MSSRRNLQYKEGELEVILGMLPTEANVTALSLLLDRSESAIKIVYRMAYERGPFGDNADIQFKKVLAAKKKIGIVVGRKNFPQKKKA